MKNLKETRKKHNLTQIKVADDLHFAHTTYTAYENGKIQPSTQTMIKLADYFNTTIDALVGHETRHIIDTSTMSLAKIELINQIKQLDENSVNNINGFLQGLLYAQKERQNIIDQVNKYKGDD